MTWSSLREVRKDYRRKNMPSPLRSGEPPKKKYCPFCYEVVNKEKCNNCGAQLEEGEEIVY